MSSAHDYLLAHGCDSVIMNEITQPCASPEDYMALSRTADVLILPAPLTSDGIHIKGCPKIGVSDIFTEVTDNILIFSGAVPKIFIKPSTKYINYLDDEDYILEMAYLTAEGTLGHLLSQYSRALRDSNIVIIGWGRIAKFLYTQLHSYTSRISTVLRRTELIGELVHAGIHACDFSCLTSTCADADIIINTVPSMILNETALDQVSCDTYIIELASNPGGVDLEAARRLRLTAVNLPGLPGKCAPVSAGEALGKCILSNLEEFEAQI